MLSAHSYGSITGMIRESLQTTLLLIRHARTVWNTEQRYAGHVEVALAPEADQQIRILTKILIREPIGAVYSSPLSRCLLTISPTAEIFDLPIGIDQRLRERDLGAWEGRPASELQIEYPGFHFPESAYTGLFTVPGAEPLAAVTKRTESVLTEIAAKHVGMTVVIATHAGIIWAAENLLTPNGNINRPWPENSTETRMIWTDGALSLA